MTSLLVRIFIKNYRETGNGRVREAYGTFASVVGVCSNILLFIIKLLTGLLFNSIAIIADAVNNLSDSVSSLVTLVGFKMSGKPADSEHPYGHARMEYVAGMIVSFFIVFLGFQLIKTSFDKILHPDPAKISWVMIFVLVISILIKLWQCLFYRRIGKTINSVTLFAVSADSRNDIIATSSILLGAIITHFTGFNLDGYMGVVVAIFILMSGVHLVMDTMNPLLGMAPEPEMVEMIEKKILSYEGIIGLHDLAVHNYGAVKCYASVHCEVPAEQDIMISHEIIDSIERDFLKTEGIHLVIHLDPVVTCDEKTNALRETVERIILKISPDIGMHDFRVVWGLHLSKVIFDIEIPFGAPWTDQEIVKLLKDKISQENETYEAVIIVDRK